MLAGGFTLAGGVTFAGGVTLAGGFTLAGGVTLPGVSVPVAPVPDTPGAVLFSLGALRRVRCVAFGVNEASGVAATGLRAWVRICPIEAEGWFNPSNAAKVAAKSTGSTRP